METRKFEIEGEIESPEEETVEEEEEVSGGNGKWLYILLAVFIILFLTSTSFFVYFQFYQGKGKWNFSLVRKADANTEMPALTAENNRLKLEIDSLKMIAVQSPAQDTAAYGELFPDNMEGEKYEVQIGFFRSFDFSVYQAALVNMNAETSNGATKLMIGRFNTPEEACKFRNDMIAMGIKGAFVVKKVDGKRVPYEADCP